MLIKRKRIFPALAASIVVPAAIFMLVSAILDNGMHIWWGIILPFVLLVTLGHAILLGLPCVILLLRWGYFSLSTLAIAGFFIGAIPAACMALLRNVEVVLGEPSSSLWAIFELGLIGMLGGITFFLIWDRQS